ncbi:MAG: GatB/YqeY domain-containing protein [Solirubrobacterales bacterium]
MSILEQVQADTKEAMRAGERDRVGALRMVANSLQQEAKSGEGDEVAALRRERKRRLEAAEAYRDGGSVDRAKAEEAEAELIQGYLPPELAADELDALVADAVEESDAAGPGDIGRVMGIVMPKVDGRADGKRVSEAVRERLGA